MLIQIVLLIALGISSLSDVRCRKISLNIILIAMVLIIIALGLYGQLSVHRILGTVMVCGLFIGMSVITGEKIGMGDGLLIALIQLAFGLQRNIEIMMLSFCIAFVIAVCLFVSKKVDRDTKIPLAPILLFCTVLRIGG